MDTKSSFKMVLLLGSLFVLCGAGFAWTIDGDSVFEENAQAKITVTPHTASPHPWFGRTFDQNFVLEYKGGAEVGGIRAVYVFEEKPVSGNVFRMVDGAWVSQKSKFHYLGDTAIGNYYYSDEFSLSPGQTVTWRLVYETEVASGKWALAFIKGEVDCLVHGSCEKQWLLDPWYDADAYVRNIFYDSCDSGNLAEWSGNTGDFSDSDDNFSRSAAGAVGIYKGAAAGDINGFVLHAKLSGKGFLDFFAQTGGTTDQDAVYKLNFRPDTPALQVVYRSGGSDKANIISVAAPAGFSGMGVFDVNVVRDTNGWWRLYLNDALIGESAWPDTNYTSGNFINYRTDTQHAGIDDIQFYSETPQQDANVIAVDGYALAAMPVFAYIFDGNLTIDFNVFDSDNRRISVDINVALTDDFNNSTAVAADLNLNESICSWVDWDVDTNRATCSWDWNIMGMANGAYYLLLTASNDVNTFFFTPTQTIGVANDVNLTILVPRDETTGGLIDTNTSSFSVEIWSDSNYQVKTGLLERTSFSVPLGEDLTIAVDTNATVYYSRTFSLRYDAPQLTDSLQPWLVKRSESVDFVFYVKDSLTLKPLADVEIAVSRYLPDVGETEVQLITTDAAGTATIPLKLYTSYDVVFSYNGVEVHAAELRPTAAALTYQVKLNITGLVVTPVTVGTLTVDFDPDTHYLLNKSDGSVDINVTVSLSGKTWAAMTVSVYDTNGYRWDVNYFGGTWTDGNVVNLVVDLNTPDRNFATQNALYVRVDVNSSDGNMFTAASIHWVVIDSAEYNLTKVLSDFADENNPNGSKILTTFLALFISILATASVVAGAGLPHDPFFLAVLFFAIMFFFLAVSWIELVPFLFAVIFTFFVALLSYRWMD